MAIRRDLRRNRIVTNVEDDIFDAVRPLAEAHGQSISELVRDIIVTHLDREGLLPERTLKSLAGIRS